MITGKMITGAVVGTWDNYIEFHKWLLNSDWGVADMGKPLQDFQRDGGVVTLYYINQEYLQKLHIKEEV